MSEYGKVAVLIGKIVDGAAADEQDVLVQMDSVCRALTEQGYEPIPVVLSLNMAGAADQLRVLQPVFVFNLVEAIEGKGNLIPCAPLLLESIRLPYTGSQTEAVFCSSNKLTAKKILRAAGIATPDYFTLADRRSGKRTGRTYIVKSAWEHASLGLDEHSVFSPAHPEDLRQKILSLEQRLGGSCFAETFIEGREFNISLLSNGGHPEVLPPAEIIFSHYPPEKIHLLCYRSKWEPGSFEYEHTRRSFEFPERDEALLGKLVSIASSCWEIFHLRGYARVDFRVDREGTPWVLEINANPCLSPDGGFVAAAEKAGYSYAEMIRRIILDIPGRQEP